MLFGSSFPQQFDQLQCETLGHLIFPPSDPNPCSLHRDFLLGHSWAHIWTETHRSHPHEGTADTEDHCPLGLSPSPAGDQAPSPSAWTAQAGAQGEQRCSEGNALAKTSQTPPDLSHHGGQLSLEHRLSPTKNIFLPLFPPFRGVLNLPGQTPRLLQASPLGHLLRCAAPLRSQAVVCISLLCISVWGCGAFGHELLQESRQLCPASYQPSSLTASPPSP